MKRRHVLIISLLTSLTVGAQTEADSIRLLVRLDDIGLSAGVDEAAGMILETGLPLSVSVIWPAPGWENVAGLLGKYPETAIGVHMDINCEYKSYRWGPVSGAETVPTLADSSGSFRAEFVGSWGNQVNLGELETEIRAQIARAQDSGLPVDYLDGHMVGPLFLTPHKNLMKAIAGELNLGLEDTFGERNLSYDESQDSTETIANFLKAIDTMQPGRLYKMIVHPALDDTLLHDMIFASQTEGLGIGPYRYNNVVAFLSDTVQAAIAARPIKLVTYRDLIEEARATRIEETVPRPGEFRLNQNRPNPFNPTTRISYEMTVPADVRLAVYDLKGAEVAVLDNGFRSAGMHSVAMNVEDLASGVYLYRLSMDETIITRKMMIMK